MRTAEPGGAAAARGVAPRRTPLNRRDVIVGVATAVAALALLLGAPALAAEDPSTSSLAFPAPFSLAWTVAAIALVLQSAAVVFARQSPRTVLIVVAALGVLPSSIAPSNLHGLGALAVMVVVVVTVLAAPVARLWPSLVVAAVLVAASETAVGLGLTGAVGSDGSGAPGAPGTATAPLGTLAGPAAAVSQGLLQAAGVVGLPLLAALVARSRLEVRRARRDEQSALVRERDALVDVAVSRERTAMARELHDIAAHHLSGIALMAAVVDRQIDTDPDRAHEGVRQMRAQSTSVLEDLRRLVGLLRDDSAATLAVETLASIPDLVARAQAQQPVEIRTLRREDRPLGDGVGPLAQLAAYRTVQEALTNAAMHAPGSATLVEVDDRAADRVVVRVTNGAGHGGAGGGAGAGAGSVAGGSGTGTGAGGHGLRGMRERAELVGADLRYGPTDDGGWQVESTISREAPPATDDAGTDGQVVA